MSLPELVLAAYLAAALVVGFNISRELGPMLVKDRDEIDFEPMLTCGIAAVLVVIFCAIWPVTALIALNFKKI